MQSSTFTIYDTQAEGKESWLLWAGRHGKQDQRTTARHVRRPHLQRQSQQQPAAPLAEQLAYLLMRHRRATALAGTRLAGGTIRRQLMKITAQITVSVRRVHIRLCSASPARELFAHAHQKLRAATG